MEDAALNSIDTGDGLYATTSESGNSKHGGCLYAIMAEAAHRQHHWRPLSKG